MTACALTAANLPDGPTGVGLLAGEQPGLEVLGDSATAAGDHARLPAKLPALAADGGTRDRLAGRRRVPYRGIGRNDLWWSLRAAAVNLRRLLALGLTRQGQA